MTIEELLKTIAVQSPVLVLVTVLLLKYGGNIMTVVRDVLSFQIEAKREREIMQLKLDDLNRRVGLIEIGVTGERSPTQMKPPIS